MEYSSHFVFPNGLTLYHCRTLSGQQLGSVGVKMAAPARALQTGSQTLQLKEERYESDYLRQLQQFPLAYCE
jgi:hypothetical protein